MRVTERSCNCPGRRLHWGESPACPRDDSPRPPGGWTAGLSSQRRAARTKGEVSYSEKREKGGSELADTPSLGARGGEMAKSTDRPSRWTAGLLPARPSEPARGAGLHAAGSGTAGEHISSLQGSPPWFPSLQKQRPLLHPAATRAGCKAGAQKTETTTSSGVYNPNSPLISPLGCLVTAFNRLEMDFLPQSSRRTQVRKQTENKVTEGEIEESEDPGRQSRPKAAQVS